VRNKTEAEATVALNNAGFTVHVTRQQSELILEDHVISQTPAGGQKAPKGSAITLVISSGTPVAPVPDLRCKTRRQAQDALAAAGFKGAFKGDGRYVVDQDPAPQTQAHKGSTVTVYMGSGVFLGC
jgi:serine/threonine-protein kinase